MATVYIRGETGSDSNGGTSAVDAIKTLTKLATLIASGDTVDMGSERVRPATGEATAPTITLTNHIGTTFRGTSSASRAKIRGGTLFSGAAWVHTGGLVYTKTIATGLTLSGIGYRWDRTDSNGNHYGHCRLEASAPAVIAAASGGAGRFFYDSGTGVVTAYFNDDPNGKTVEWVAAQSTPAAIVFSGGSGNTVENVDFELYPVRSGQFGWGVRFYGSRNNNVINCDHHDMGAHAGGTLGGNGNSSGNTYTNCAFRGLCPTDAYLVWHQLNSDGALSGCNVTNCTFDEHRWLGINELVLDGQADAVGALAANSQTGVYSHSDTGVPIADVQITGGTFTLREDGSIPWKIDNATVVLDTDWWTYSAAPMRVHGSTVVISSYCSWAGLTAMFIAYRNVTWRNILPLGGGGAAAILQMAAPNAAGMLFENNVFDFTLDDGGAGANQVRAFYIAGPTGTCQFRRLNCTMVNRETVAPANFHGFYDYGSQDINLYLSRGCLYVHRTTGAATAFAFGDVGTSVANHAGHLDNAYFGVRETGTARWSVNGSIDTGAEWMASVDTAGTAAINILSVNPLVDIANGDYNLTAAAKLLRRTTSTIRPSGSGINGQPYSGNFGAYQYSSGAGGSRSGRSRRVSRVNRG